MWCYFLCMSSWFFFYFFLVFPQFYLCFPVCFFNVFFKSLEYNWETVLERITKHHIEILFISQVYNVCIWWCVINYNFLLPFSHPHSPFFLMYIVLFVWEFLQWSSALLFFIQYHLHRNLCYLQSIKLNLKGIVIVKLLFNYPDNMCFCVY